MKRLILTCAALACCGLLADLPKLRDSDKSKIDALIGKDYLARPQKAPRVLVFYRTEGFVHGDAIVCANEAFRVASEKTGAFTVKFSVDYADLKPESLARFDVLVLNNTTNLKTKENPFLAWSIPDFVASGKGLVSLHAGCDNFADCPAAANVAAGCFAGHPWGAGGTWSFEVCDPAHPVSKPFVDAFKGVKFKMSDEIYQHRGPAYDDGKIHPLVLLDFSDPEVAKRDRIRKESTFYPVSWLRRFGKGRVFYTTFGHDSRAWTEPARLRHHFDGYLYAAGLLKCDDTPRGFDMTRVREAKTFEEAEMLLRDMLANGGNDWLVDDTMRKAQKLLKDGAVPGHVKEGIRRAMRGFGAKPEVQPQGEPPRTAVGIAVPKAVALIGKDPANFDRLMALSNSRVKPEDALQIRLAVVKNADKVPAKKLVAAYGAGYAQSGEGANKIKAAIIACLARKGAKEGEPLALEALASDDEDLAATGAYALRFIGSGKSVPELVKSLKRGGLVQKNAEFALQDIADPEAGKALFKMAESDNGLFRTIARRADSSQIELWTPFVKSGDESVRKAAWTALSRQLTDKTLPAAAKWVSHDMMDGEVTKATSALKAAAKNAEQADCDKYLGGAWKTADAAGKRVIAAIMGQHPSPAVVGLLEKGLSDASADVRKAAAQGLAACRPRESFPALMKAYSAEADDGARREELGAIFEVAGLDAADVLRTKNLTLFKAAKPADRIEVAKFMFRSSGFPAFDDLQTLFGDAKVGADAKKSYRELCDAMTAGASDDMAKPLDRSKWAVNASRNGHNAKNAIDGNDGSRWDTGRSQEEGDWFTVNLGENVFVHSIVLHAEKSANDTPAGAEVFMSQDGANWAGPVARCDDKSRGVTELKVGASGRWIKIVVTGRRPGNFWSINELEIRSGVSKEALQKYRQIADSIK